VLGDVAQLLAHPTTIIPYVQAQCHSHSTLLTTPI
jgi:hypothetical protein